MHFLMLRSFRVIVRLKFLLAYCYDVAKNEKKSKSCTHHQISTSYTPPNADFKDIIFMYKTILLTKYKLSEKYQLFKENKKFDLKWF